MNPSEIILDNSNLRIHQVEAKELVFTKWGVTNSVMLQMPTGTGKTYLFCSVIQDILKSYKSSRKEVNILVVVHRMELIDQISETLTKFNIPHGFIQGTREQHLWRRVQVASIMSLLTERNYYNTLRQEYDYIIVDEAHHSLAESYVNLFNLFPDARKLGVTATPWRLNHESFLKLYDTLITSRPISWFINHGILSDFDYVSIKPDSQIQALVDHTQVSQTGDFGNQELDNAFNTMRIRSKLFESYMKFAKGRKGIIYAINRAHAAKIAALYSQHGVKAVAIDCETPKEERQFLIEQFKDGQIKVLVNVDIFTEGFDCPDVSFIQLARPTRSLALYLQQVGRGLRISQGKEKTIILDNVGLYNYFGLPDANRKWQYHFKGIEDIECNRNERSHNTDMANEPEPELEDPNKYDEEDEEMVVVHGTSTSSQSISSGSIQNNPIATEGYDSLNVEEFNVADYYLIRGNEGAFKAYPFIKKRGKRTEGVSSCVYEYRATSHPIIFTKDIYKNKEIIDQDIKLQTLLTFSAFQLHLEVGVVYDPIALSSKIDGKMRDTISIFSFLKLLNQLSAN